jgi:hypothetical protein
MGHDDFGLLRVRLHGAWWEERVDLSPHVIWLRYAIAVVVILITGRIHSKRIDERDAQEDINECWRRD